MELRVHNIDIGSKNNDLIKLYPYLYSDKRCIDQHMDLLLQHSKKQIHVLYNIDDKNKKEYSGLFEEMKLKYDSKRYNSCNDINYMIGWNDNYYDITFLKQDYFTKTGKIIPLKLRDENIEEHKKIKIKEIIYDLCLGTEYEKSIVWYNCYDKNEDKNIIIGVLHFDKNDIFKERAIKKLNEFTEIMKQTNIPIIITGDFNIYKSNHNFLKNTTHNSWIDFDRQNIVTTYCPNIFDLYNENNKLYIDDSKIYDRIYNLIINNLKEDITEIKFNKNLINPKSHYYKKIIEDKDIYNKNYELINEFNNLYKNNSVWKKTEKLEENINNKKNGLTNGCISYNIKFTTKKLNMTKDMNSNLYHSTHYPILYKFNY